MRPQLRPLLVLVTLAGLLVTALPAAAGTSRAGTPSGEAASPGSGLSLADWLSSWLGSFWPGAGHALAPAPRSGSSPGPGRLRPDFGCGIDPSGGCVSPPPATRPDFGCGIDPDGRCVSPPAAQRPLARGVAARRD
jgi:hypothetical protein